MTATPELERFEIDGADREPSFVLDGPPFPLETHAAECVALMAGFLRRMEGAR